MMRLVLTVSVSTAITERSFATMNVIKTITKMENDFFDGLFDVIH